MREIKFRAWNRKEKGWQSGNSNLLMNMGGHLFWDFAMDCQPIGSQENTEYVLCQYTGLKDKTGKEDYEGDLSIHHSARDGLVYKTEFIHGRFIHVPINGNSYDRSLEPWNFNDYTIIGNLYENPELLEEQA